MMAVPVSSSGLGLRGCGAGGEEGVEWMPGADGGLLLARDGSVCGQACDDNVCVITARAAGLRWRPLAVQDARHLRAFVVSSPVWDDVWNEVLHPALRKGSPVRPKQEHQLLRRPFQRLGRVFPGLVESRDGKPAEKSGFCH